MRTRSAGCVLLGAALVVAMAIVQPAAAPAGDHDAPADAPAEKAGDTAGAKPVPADWPGKIVIAYPSLGSDKDTLARYKTLDDFLSTRLGLPVEARVTDGYVPIYSGFQLGTMDVAYLGPMSYVELCKHVKADPLVMELSIDGRAGYYSVIIARKDSGFAKVEDGRGRKMAMVDPDSTSGFLIPCLYLMRELNATPATFASEVVFTGSHDRLIAGVANGTYDLGATNDIDLDRVGKELGIPISQFTVLWKSRVYPSSPFAARAELPKGLRAALKLAFMAAGQDDKVKASLGIGGFALADDAAYNPVRELESSFK